MVAPEEEQLQPPVLDPGSTVKMCAFAEKIRRKAEVVNARYREEIKHLLMQRDKQVCDKDGDFEKQIDWHVIDARKEGRNTEVRHLPLHLEVYALNRYPILRRVYVDSEVEFGHLFPRLVLFREETYNGGEIEMMWMALYRERACRRRVGSHISLAWITTLPSDPHGCKSTFKAHSWPS